MKTFLLSPDKSAFVTVGDETGDKKSSHHSQAQGQPAAVGHEGGALPPTTPHKRPEPGLALWAEHARSLARSGGRSKPKPITAGKTLDADKSGSPATDGYLGPDVDTPAPSHSQDQHQTTTDMSRSDSVS